MSVPGVDATFVQWNCTVLRSISPASVHAAMSSSAPNKRCREESSSCLHQATSACTSSVRLCASHARRRVPGTGVNGTATTALG
jgi:hypothetical protein